MKLAPRWLVLKVLAVIFVSFLKSSQGCRRMLIKPCVANQNLTNHVLTTLEVKDKKRCAIECFIEKKCVSYNLGPVSGEKRTCVLSDSDHVINPENIKKGSTYEYCSFENPCSSNTCPNGTHCRPDETFTAHECVCSDKKNCPVEKKCDAPLGMEDGVIPDASITASSTIATGHEPYRARLNYQGLPVKQSLINAGCWAAAKAQKGEYLQVDLGKPTWVTKVATQGRSTFDQWVTSYSIAYSLDGVSYHMYKDQQTNKDKVFTGNSDRDTVVTHPIQPDAIKAQYIRYIVWSWELYIAMRAELYGCPVQ